VNKPYIPHVGSLVLYTHEGSGIHDRFGAVVREDDEWFYVRLKGYSIEFPLHKDNSFNMVKDALDAENLKTALAQVVPAPQPVREADGDRLDVV
jgi:hypothetical protein